jgi:hypothetical protein
MPEMNPDTIRNQVIEIAKGQTVISVPNPVPCSLDEFLSAMTSPEVVINTFMPSDLYDKDSLNEEEFKEIAFSVYTNVLSFTYGSTGKVPFSFNDNCPPLARQNLLLQDFIAADGTKETLDVLGVKGFEKAFSMLLLPLGIAQCASMTDVRKSIEALNKINDNEDRIKNNINVIMGFNIPLSTSLDDIEALARENNIDVNLFLARQKPEFNTVEVIHRFKEFLDPSRVMIQVDFTEDAFRTLLEENYFGEVRDQLFTVANPMIMELADLREKYWDKFSWERALVKYTFSEEILKRIITEGKMNWAVASVFQVMSDEMILENNDEITFWRPEFNFDYWFKGENDNKELREEYVKHTPANETISWNEVIRRHKDKQELLMLAAITVSEMPIAVELTDEGGATVESRVSNPQTDKPVDQRIKHKLLIPEVVNGKLQYAEEKDLSSFYEG